MCSLANENPATRGAHAGAEMLACLSPAVKRGQQKISFSFITDMEEVDLEFSLAST